jgi:VWFA-related protein
MKKSNQVGLLLLMSVLSVNAAWAQQAQNAKKPQVKTAAPASTDSDDSFNLVADASVVTVHVNAFDSNGRPVWDLKQGDFKIQENGVDQPIQDMRLTQPPYNMALMIDCSGSMKEHFETVKKAAQAFIDQSKRPEDKFMLVCFNDDFYIDDKVGLTNDRAALSGELAKLKPPRGQTAIATALWGTAQYLSLKAPEQYNAIVLLTDGEDNPAPDMPNKSEAQMLKELDKTGTTVHIVDIASMDGGTPSDKAQTMMKNITTRSGGTRIQVSSEDQLVQAYKDMFDHTAKKYVLTYSPTNTAKDGTYRSINVTTKNPNVNLTWRHGYFAAEDDDDAIPAKKAHASLDPQKLLNGLAPQTNEQDAEQASASQKPLGSLTDGSSADPVSTRASSAGQ